MDAPTRPSRFLIKLAANTITIADCTHHGLNIDVIAEGVETQVQREFLERHGCHAFQGYLYSHPLSLAQLEAYLQA